jgi:hypothetical protein
LYSLESKYRSQPSEHFTIYRPLPEGVRGVEGGGAAVVEQGGELGEGDDKVVQDVRHGVVGRHQRALREPVQHATQHFRLVRLYTGRRRRYL